MPLPGPGAVTTTSGRLVLDVVIASIALIADDQRDIGRIACDGIVQEHRHTQGFQTLFEGIGSGLTLHTG